MAGKFEKDWRTWHVRLGRNPRRAPGLGFAGPSARLASRSSAGPVLCTHQTRATTLFEDSSQFLASSHFMRRRPVESLVLRMVAAGQSPTSNEVSAVPAAPDAAQRHFEVTRRRNLAIISHPDAGKSTLTEKLLLYGGAIQQAGSVRARRAERNVSSDWMKIEQERGISITSAVLTFEYDDKRISLVDTPGHADFGEDTYRTLSAVDNAVMLVDAAKGLEPQTRKLFEVCRMRNLPTFTFVNKLDRPSLNAFEICDQIEAEFGLDCYPVVWPIGDGDRFKGVYERSTRLLHLYTRAERGKKAGDLPTICIDDPKVPDILEEDMYLQLLEDVEILESMSHEYDRDRVMAGELSPVFFGSAMNNFGVELFLQRFLELGRSPPHRESTSGDIDPERPQFTGQVFKLQANMDPKHRDRLAFVRVFSGVFEKGMKVGHSRLPGKSIALNRPQSLFAADRYSLETAFAGDVVGLNNPGVFAIGDTIFEEGSERVVFPGIPSFSPELFAYVKNPNPSAYKNFRKGLNQLLEEGAVQMLRAKEDQGNEDPILAAVGQLQYDVVQRRLKDEYNVESSLETMPYTVARWVNGPGDSWEALEACGRIFNVFYAKDRWGRPVLLFKNEWSMNSLIQDRPELQLAPWAFAPIESD
jgi:peptide chain release factor 3